MDRNEPCWKSVNDELPPHFVSVLGYMPDAYPMPTVRECYRVEDNSFYIPALGGFEAVTHWLPMPEYRSGGDPR